ncbi:hypothetical protein BGP_2975 [Beggiatoa sp. PS]|nr:hypothetical protein BGP_2975 [Beggiatoa sp. PS]
MPFTKLNTLPDNDTGIPPPSNEAIKDFPFCFENSILYRLASRCNIFSWMPINATKSTHGIGTKPTTIEPAMYFLTM